jgi:hypothetical protein
MNDGPVIPPAIADDELLARFVLFSGWVRSDRTLRPDAFIPFPWPNLSVTRHLELSKDELWTIGQHIADNRPSKLYGRADLQVLTILEQSLRVVRPRHLAITQTSLAGHRTNRRRRSSLCESRLPPRFFQDLRLVNSTGLDSDRTGG